jgi:hypothetical protein
MVTAFLLAELQGNMSYYRKTTVRFVRRHREQVCVASLLSPTSQDALTIQSWRLHSNDFTQS